MNAQYTYGWAVPLLGAYLFWLRWKDRPRAESHAATPAATALVAVCAFLFLSTRLMQEANPEWRLVSWLLALETIGLSLAAIWLLGGTRQLKHLWFPFAFFLVAVPWLRPIEAALVQTLSDANAAAGVEILAAIGVPAFQHGNVIEVSTGVVGIDEACSGIRSFQATLMISLFLGELYRFSVLRRIGLCLLGFALSFFFNVARTTLLTWVAAHKGTATIATWHDPAGSIILVACFISLWLIALALRKAESRKQKAVGRAAVGDQRVAQVSSPATPARIPAGSSPISPVPSSKLDVGCSMLDVPSSSLSAGGEGRGEVAPHSFGLRLSTFCFLFSAFRISAFQRFSVLLPAFLPIALIGWFLLSAAATHFWYGSHERDRLPAPGWSVEWPQEQTAFKEAPVSEKDRALLRFTEAKSAIWNDPEDVRWQMFYFRWLPGRAWVQLVSDHNPTICLPASGRQLLSVSSMEPTVVNGLQLRFRVYRFVDGNIPAYAFYSVSEDGVKDQRLPSESVTIRDRFAAVWQGRRNPGQRVLEIGVWGISEAKEAEAALIHQLERLIKVGPPNQ